MEEVFFSIFLAYLAENVLQNLSCTVIISSYFNPCLFCRESFSASFPASSWPGVKLTKASSAVIVSSYFKTCYFKFGVVSTSFFDPIKNN